MIEHSERTYELCLKDKLKIAFCILKLLQVDVTCCYVSLGEKCSLLYGSQCRYLVLYIASFNMYDTSCDSVCWGWGGKHLSNWDIPLYFFFFLRFLLRACLFFLVVYNRKGGLRTGNSFLLI